VNYFDSSALTKLVVREAESSELRTYIRGLNPDSMVTSALATVEVPRAVGPHGEDTVVAAHAVLHQFGLIPIDAVILARAAELLPWTLRTLDAIHVASALLLEDECEAVVTYDSRMSAACRAAGLRVASPGADT